MDVSGKRVLVVEDQFLIRLLLVEGLTNAGFEVAEAQDGDTALILLNERDWLDLVTDIQMPGRTDGNAVAVYAKARHPGLPVIYASGRQDTLKNTLSHQDTFVAKPFGAQQIVVLVRRLLGGTERPDMSGEPDGGPTFGPDARA